MKIYAKGSTQTNKQSAYRILKDFAPIFHSRRSASSVMRSNGLVPLSLVLLASLGQLAGALELTGSSDDLCVDSLCSGLPMNCLSSGSGQPVETISSAVAVKKRSLCNVLLVSKRFIDPARPAARDIMFELIALPVTESGSYASVGFSENGRMQGFVTECIHYPKLSGYQSVRLDFSYNIPGMYTNVKANITSGIKNLGVAYENGYYQCRWIVESHVQFEYRDPRDGIVHRMQDDLGYKNYHILLASGPYNVVIGSKEHHTDRVSSLTPISLAQTGQIKSLGTHILIRIHGSLMIAIWVGLVSLSIVLARYYKNEWSNSKINELAIWFVAHRAFMLTAWFGSIIAAVFALLYTETFHPGPHQIAGTICLTLATVQVLGGLFRPGHNSTKRIYFNWAHFTCGNLSYLSAMICLVTATFLPPANLPPLYIWVIAAFVGTYAAAHALLTIHQYTIHRSSKISITPMSELNSNSSTNYMSSGFISTDPYASDQNSPFRQFMLGILVTIVVIFIIFLISLVNIR